MTDREWIEIAATLEYAFKGELSEAAELVYRHHLDGLSAERVAGALALLISQGQVFLPAVGEVVVAARSSVRPPDPTFDEAWAVVRPALINSYTHHCPRTRAKEYEEMVLARLPAAHAADVVVAWVASYGPPRMGCEPVDGPEHGGAVLHGLKLSYAQFLERVEARRAQGLPILEEAVAAKAGDLHQPDFSGAIGRPPLKQIDGGQS